MRATATHPAAKSTQKAIKKRQARVTRQNCECEAQVGDHTKMLQNSVTPAAEAQHDPCSFRRAKRLDGLKPLRSPGTSRGYVS